MHLFQLLTDSEVEDIVPVNQWQLIWGCFNQIFKMHLERINPVGNNGKNIEILTVLLYMEHLFCVIWGSQASHKSKAK